MHYTAAAITTLLCPSHPLAATDKIKILNEDPGLCHPSWQGSPGHLGAGTVDPRD